MKFGIFNAMHYSDGELQRGSVIPPKLFRPEMRARSAQFSMRMFELADDLGFDFVTVAEHHYGTAMTPSPLVAAAAVSQRVRNAKIAVLGPILPFLNPVRTAEEFAMVDNLSGGRLIAGFLRGTPHEFLTYGFNPDESRERMNEGIELILKAWTEPEPFGWEGIYYRFRTIAVSPRVVQLPYPRVMVSGNSVDSLNFAASHRFDIGFSLANPATCGEHFAHYQAAAAAAGWTPSADNALYRHHCYVAATDAKAAEDVERHAFWASHGGHRNQEAVAAAALTPARSTGDVIGALSAQLGHYGKNSAIDMSIQPIVGAPETVIRRIREIAAIGRTGRFDLVFRAGRLPEELVENSMRLFGKEVMPVLQKEAA